MDEFERALDVLGRAAGDQLVRHFSDLYGWKLDPGRVHVSEDVIEAAGGALYRMFLADLDEPAPTDEVGARAAAARVIADVLEAFWETRGHIFAEPARSRLREYIDGRQAEAMALDGGL